MSAGGAGLLPLQLSRVSAGCTRDSQVTLASVPFLFNQHFRLSPSSSLYRFTIRFSFFSPSVLINLDARIVSPDS